MANAFGPTQWLILIAIVLLLFGGSRIPEIMRGLGSGMKEFKKGLHEEEEAEAASATALRDAPPPSAASSPAELEERLRQLEARLQEAGRTNAASGTEARRD
ncbi:MAG TPA: twin-arginine translocase TatA/TatE family subunit [Chthonomonadales bacterium]|nr:twin-arginine translocase TatA/TatE family subunit [Chthonomonadales bacterium]